MFFKLFLLIVIGVVEVQCWTQGDHVPLMMKMNFDEKITEWKPLTPELTPRFGKNKVVHFNGFENVNMGKHDLKWQFELGHGLNRRTTWIPVYSGCYRESKQDCHVLIGMEFRFKYEMGNFGKIVAFTTTPHYASARDSHANHGKIVLRYVWKEEQDIDVNSAMLVVYAISVFGGVLLLTIMSINTEAVRKGEMLVKDMRRQ